MVWNPGDETQVTLVVDPDFGQRAKAQSKLGPVWLVRSFKNCEVVEELWALDRGRYGDRVTLFESWSGASSEELAVSFIGTVDEHHPRWRKFEIIGVNLSPRLLEALKECAPGSAKETETGLIFFRM